MAPRVRRRIQACVDPNRRSGTLRGLWNRVAGVSLETLRRETNCRVMTPLWEIDDETGSAPMDRQETADPGPVSRRRLTLTIVAILLGGWFLYGWQIAQRGLWSSHEGRAAQDAQAILDDGDWLVPHLFTGEPELQKPPLYYWMVACFGWLNHGHVDATSVRMPALLAGLAGLVVVFSLGRRMWDLETGLWATGILALSTRYAWLARVGRIDMPLCLIVTSSLALFWLTVAPKKAGSTEPLATLPRFVYVLLGLGVLLKGPVAIIMYGLPTVTYLAVTGVPIIPRLQPGWWETWKRFRVVSGIAIVLAITLPWFIYASIATDGEFFWSFFIYHNIERAVGSSEALKSGPVWFYIPRLFVDAFPWSLLLPALWYSLWHHRRKWWPAYSERPGSEERTPKYLFLVCWSVSLFVFLSLVSFKRADYLLPAFPPVALLLAGWLRDRGWRRRTDEVMARMRHPRRRRRLILTSAAVLAVVMVPLLFWGGVEFLEKGLVHSLLKIDLLRDHLNETDVFMMTHVEQIMRQSWPILVIGGIVVVASVWLTYTGWHQNQQRRVLVGLAAPWLVGFLFQIHVLLPALDPLREMSRFARAIRAVAGQETTVYYFGKFDADLAFHIGRPARAIDDWESLVKLSQQPEPCFVVMKADQLDWVRRDPRLATWEPIVDNRKLAFGGHRDHRLLLASKLDAIADRLDKSQIRR